MNNIKNICINCGSSPGLLPNYMKVTKQLGALLADNNIRIIYGGADVGLMGAVANSSMEKNGEVIGVIPQKIAEKVKHNKLTKLITVSTMHERKQKMFELSDAFIALPGGFGTLEEMFEILTWAQLGYHTKPCGILNIEGYYDHLIKFIDNAVEHRFIKSIHMDMLIVENEPEKLLNKLIQYEPKYEDKWIDRK